MSSDSRRQYLTPSDMTMIEQVLAEAGLRKEVPSALSRNAAKFLTRKFQDGLVDRSALASELRRHLSTLS
ncbi:hypothetical protein M2281_001127 [Mesorhizobium soli]|uniref:hypothetical protein n=1 Tax=Pseudaminobacter soli (ex Li et al. 2025) TaxID=1295366 RepID=UPI002476F71E|nr:hypothetical protein [Mesorhizobium soli]MDH6230555.1 hypothetical protein [Mesorhizobium soli]